MIVPCAVHLVLFLGKKEYCDFLIAGIFYYTKLITFKAKQEKVLETLSDNFLEYSK